MNFLERHSLAVHLLVAYAGFCAAVVALITGEWRLLIVAWLAYQFTVKT